MRTILSEIKKAKKQPKSIVPSIRNVIDGTTYRMKVYVTNNAYDENPVWEDASLETLLKKKHLFTNTRKTANEWGVALKIEYSDDPDLTPPVLELSYVKNSDIATITATATDDSGVGYIVLPNNIQVKSDVATYSVKRDGTYTFNAYDIYGNNTSKSITIAEFDSTAPTLTLQLKSEEVSKTVTIVVTATDENEIQNVFARKTAEFFFPTNIGDKTMTFEYSVTSNGVYEFVATDGMGNEISQSIEVKNVWIDPEITSLDNVFQFKTNAEYNTDYFNATLIDKGEGVCRTNWGDGVENEELTHTYTKRGTYKIVTRHFINDGSNSTGNYKFKRRIIACNQIGENVNDLSYFLRGCTNLTTLPSKIPNVSNMKGAFGSTSITSLPFALPESLEDATSLFAGCDKLTTAPTIPSNVLKVTYMFDGCTSLKTAPDLGHLYRVTNCECMFNDCTSLKTAPANLPSALEKAEMMFAGCTSLTNVTFSTPINLVRYNSMFARCTTLTKTIEVNWGNDVSIAYMYDGCTNLKDISNIYNLMYAVETGSYPNLHFKNCFKNCTAITTPDTYANLSNGDYWDWFRANY